MARPVRGQLDQGEIEKYRKKEVQRHKKGQVQKLYLVEVFPNIDFTL